MKYIGQVRLSVYTKNGFGSISFEKINILGSILYTQVYNHEI